MVSHGQGTIWRSPSLSRSKMWPLSSLWTLLPIWPFSSYYEDIRPVMPCWHQYFTHNWETHGGRERLMPSGTGPKDLPTAHLKNLKDQKDWKQRFYRCIHQVSKHQARRVKRRSLCLSFFHGFAYTLVVWHVRFPLWCMSVLINDVWSGIVQLCCLFTFFIHQWQLPFFCVFFCEHVQWSSVDKVMEYHGGGMKTERVMNMYIQVWVIPYPQCSSEVKL